MNEFDIIIRPQITEKSTDAAANGKYTFVVDLNATQIDIKKAIAHNPEPLALYYFCKDKKQAMRAVKEISFVPSLPTDWMIMSTLIFLFASVWNSLNALPGWSLVPVMGCITPRRFR